MIMYSVDPNQLIQMIKNGANPQQLMLNVLENQMRGTPTGDNLINMIRQGRTSEIEQFARNFSKQNGKDFDTEFNNFKKMLGI